MASQIDLDAYFRRVRWTGATAPNLDSLAGLLRAHTSHIPFENLDVLLGRPIRLDLESFQAKLVRAKRGGYCYEHASLFAAVLEAIGFRLARHAARVILFDPATEAPRSHMFLTVPIHGTTYVVDPGFGPFAPPFPVPLVDGDSGQTHWMVRSGDLWTLHVPRDGQTVAGWVTTLEHENAIDFEVANHFIATHPQSMFTNVILLSARTPQGRVNVMNRGVTILNGSGANKHQLADRSALRQLLVEHFGFDLPEVEQMKVPAIPEWN
jgi:N-hydroxyarylamine O-acetyltransferase